jgi:hypothetical protein
MKSLSAAIFLAFLSLLIKPAYADDASQRALAGKLIDLTNGKNAMRVGFDAVFSGMLDNLRQHGMPDQGLQEIQAAVNKWYDSEINFDDIRPQMVDIYVKDFDEDDLKQIVAFYESPVGQKAIKNLPTVMQQAAAMAQAYTKSKIPTLNADLEPIFEKYQAQMQQSAPGTGAPPADAPGGAPGN